MATTKSINDFESISAYLCTSTTIKLLSELKLLRSDSVTVLPYTPIREAMQCANDLTMISQTVVLTEREDDNRDDYFFRDIKTGHPTVRKFGKHLVAYMGLEKVHVVRTPLNQGYYEFSVRYFFKSFKDPFTEINERLFIEFAVGEPVDEPTAVHQMFGGNPFSKVISALSGVGDLTDEAMDVLPKVSSSLDNLDELISKCSKILEPDNIRDMSKPFNQTIDKITGAVDRASKDVSDGMCKVMLLGALIFHLKNRSWLSTATLLGVGAWFLMNNKDALIEIATIAYSKLSSVFNARHQASGTEIFTKTLVTALIGVQFANARNTSTLAVKVLKAIGDFSKFSNSFESIVNFVILVFCNTMKFLSLEDYIPKDLKNFGIDSQQLKEFLSDVDDVITRVNSKKFLVSLVNYHLVKDLKKRGDLIAGVLKVNSHDYRTLSTTMTALAGILKYLEKRVNIHDNRVEPRVYRFAGGTGIFKSQMSQHLACHLVIATANDEERKAIGDKPMTAVYNLCEATKYDDNYDMAKKVILIDDIDQFRTLPGDLDCVWAKIWGMCTELPGSTHQAALDDKGLIIWNSPFVITTTNVPIPPTDNVRDEKALKRRIKRAWYVYPKDEFCSNPNEDDIMCKRFDVDKLPPGELGETDSHPRNLLFQPYSPIDGAYIAGPMTYDQVCSAILDDYDQSRKYFAQKCVSLKESMDRADQIRRERVDQLKNVDLYSQLDEFIQGMDFDDNSDEEIQMEAVHQISASAQRSLQIEERTLRTQEPEPMQEQEDIEFGLSLRFARDFLLNHNENNNRFGDPYFLIHTVSIDMFINYTNRMNMFDGIDLQTRLAVFDASFGNHFWDIMDFPQGVGGFEYKMGQLNLPLLQVNMPFVNIAWNPDFARDLNNSRSMNQLFSRFLFAKFGSFGEVIYFLLFGSSFYITFKLFKILMRTVVDFVKGFFPKVDSQSTYDGRMRKNQTKARFTRSEKPVSLVNPQISQGLNPNGLERIESLVNKSQYSVCIEDTVDGKVHFAHQLFGFFVKGRIFMAPAHLKLKLEDYIEDGTLEWDHPIYLIKENFDHTRDFSQSYKMTVKEFLADTIMTQESYERDVCLYVMPRTTRPHRDFSSCFIDAADIPTFDDGRFSVRLINQNRPGSGRREAFTDAASVISCVPFSKDEPGRAVGMKYPFPTQDGDCGSIVQILSNSIKFSGLIAGWHIGRKSDGSEAYANFIPKQLIVDLISKGPTDNVFDAEPTLPEVEGVEHQFGKRVILEAIPPSNSPTTTCFKQSKICGVFGDPIGKPAWLRDFTKDGIKVSPREISQRGYSPPDIHFNQTEIEIVAEAVFRDIQSNSKNSRKPRLLTLEEAIAGIEGVKNVDSINMSSSPGWPYSSGRKLPGKRDFFGLDGTERSSEAYRKLVSRIDEIIAAAKEGKRLLCVYADHLKDEIRSNDRVDAGKSRNFSGFCLDYNLVYRVYFGDWIRYIMDNYISNSIAVGANPYADDWDFLGKRQSAKSGGRNCIGGDFSGFDKNQFVQVTQTILMWINKWYDDGSENALIRTVLWYEITHSRHVIGTKICEWRGSLPSGNTLTTLINSLYNLIAHRWCYYIAHSRDMMCLTHFERNVSIIVYGDDSHLEVSDEIVNIFNENTLPGLMSTLGLIYTNETKNASLSPTRKLSETSFLKRTWRLEPLINKYVAPLELNVVLHMADWSRKGEFYVKGTRDTVDIMMKEFSLHGKDVFLRYTPILVRVSQRELNHTPAHLSFRSNLFATRSWEAFF